MTSLMDSTPVLVGVGTAMHRADDGPTPAPMDLIATAATAAGLDAGSAGPGLLADTAWLGVAKGTWTHDDPGGVLADTLGLTDPHTVLAEVGILQQTVIARAIEAVRDGAPAALVVGGEAAHGSAGGAATAVAGSLREKSRGPDERWTTEDYGISHEEMARGFVDPPVVYAIVESALAHAAGRSPIEQRAHLGRLQARFATVAADNPDGWRRDRPAADAISTPSAENRMVAAPYTKLCCSNLRVNQAGALLFTTIGRARAAGISEDRWVFPATSTESNLSVPVLHRPALHRSPGAALAGRRALDIAGLTEGDIDHLDLYSCFPAAVQVYAAELGIDLEDDSRAPTVTGGMTFGGGPLNNYVLQSTAAMARTLRDDPGTTGLVTSVSGMITKQGFAVWSANPPTEPFHYEDVTDEARSEDVRRSETAAHTGDVTIVGHTVQYDREGPTGVLAITETADGTRLLAASSDADLIDLFSSTDQIGTEHPVTSTTLTA